ncbi:MAG: hydroxyacid dehydrogenase [Oscillospiraceae bacterium]|nr:hydroxyacid dehydrogenase [Oscillospiraceae bacterium]
MKIAVLDAATLGGDLDLSPLYPLGEVAVYPGTAAEELAERIADADVIIANKLKLNRGNLGSARNLKLICICATGYDCIDVAYCRERGIGVCNVPGYSTESVSQLTLAMALSLMGHLKEYRECVHSGAYSRGGVANCLTPVWHEIAGKTWGVIGGGNIGGRVAGLAEAFGCKVLMCRRKTDERYETVGVDTLCERSDIISVHVPLNEGTRGMVGAAQIGKMKQNAIFINVARGLVADEEALTRAIEEDRIGGLGVDVFSVEPFGEDHPYTRILDRDNVLLTPHTAWGAIETRNRCLAEVAKNIAAWQQSGIRNRVDL